MESKKDNQVATKIDIEELASMTAKEFSTVYQKFDAVDKRFDRLDDKIDALETKVDSGFVLLRQEILDGLQAVASVFRQEMQDGFRAVIAVVKTKSIEHSGRFEVLERDMKQVKAKVGM